MRALRVGVLVVSTALALLAAGAATAQAVQGPFWTIEKKVLLSGVKSEIVAKQNGEQKVEVPGKSVTCEKLKFSSGAAIEGMEPKNSDVNAEKIEYSGCLVSGNGSPCAVTTVAGMTNKEYKTKELTSELGYSESNPGKTEGKGRILMNLAPKVGKELAEIKFEGTGCTVASTKIVLEAGSDGMIGEFLNEKEEEVPVGKGEEFLTNGFELPNFPSKSFFLEQNGKLVEQKGGVEAFGQSAFVGGKAKLKTALSEKWKASTE